MGKNFKAITKNRRSIEVSVLGSLLKDFTLYGQYNKLSDKDFKIEEIRFFFNIGKTLSKKYNELDEVAILELIGSDKTMKKKYEDYGEWYIIEEYMDYANSNNIDAYIDELAKNNYLLYLDDIGIDIMEEMEYEGEKFVPFNLFKEMSCNEVYEFYEGLISKGEVNSISNKYKRENLLLDKSDIQKLLDKEAAGTPYNIMFEYTEKEIGLSDSEEIKYIYGLPITSSRTRGFSKGGGISVLSGFSGNGKSTLTFLYFIIPMIYQGERICIFSNEQGSLYFKAILTSFVAYNVFGYKNLRRADIIEGNMTEEDLDIVIQVQEFLKRRGYDDSLTFYELEEFDIDEILKVSTSLITHEGYTGILVDTFKSEDMSDSQYVGKILENAKKIDAFGNKHKILTFLTMQLTPSTTDKTSYLTVSDLSECKGVVTVCDLLFLMRRVQNELELDEKNKKYFLKPYKLKYNDITEEYEREYVEFTEEDLTKDYRLLFLAKSRKGADNMIILLRFNGSTGFFTEVGYVSHVFRGALSY